MVFRDFWQADNAMIQRAKSSIRFCRDDLKNQVATELYGLDEQIWEL